MAGVLLDPRLRLAEGALGRGLFVYEGVPAGTVLISVPADAVLTSDLAGKLLQAETKEDLMWGHLPAFLVRARAEVAAGADAFALGPYIAALPQEFPTLPISLEPQEAAHELRGTVLAPATEQMRSRLLADRDSALDALQGKGNSTSSIFSDEAWLWACGVLLTRGGFGVSLGGAVALVPFVDFANCENVAPSCEVRLGLNNEVQLVARQALPRGAEATFDYGCRSPEQTLFTFGFFPVKGEASVTSPLSLEPLDTSGASPLRSALLRLIALDQPQEEQSRTAHDASLRPPSSARLRRKGAQGVDASELIAAANILEMSDVELKEAAVEAAAQNAVPQKLRESPSPAARARLVPLLEAWHEELLSGGPGQPGAALKSSPASLYRGQCLSLVGETLRALRQ